MPHFLGVDTGGTFTDAAILDVGADRIVGHAKALTTRADLAIGIGGAIDAALAASGVGPADVALVSLSTTLATNALVEGQGGRVALIAIGFDAADLARAGLADALRGDPVLRLAGGHNHAGAETAALDLGALDAALPGLAGEVVAFAVAGRFATRNPAHEQAVRARLRAATGLPVTTSHELSANLNGPKRALTAVLNARLIGMIDRLVTASEAHLAKAGIQAPLMVVRGDGALISAAMVRERPIETILSGPAASIVGARWLTGAADALVSDIGGTTTDVALLRGGLPEIDPDGAEVGGFRTMVEAVAMRTSGLGGDSEVHLLTEGLLGGLRLGPRRLVPIALLARQDSALVHAALDRWLASDVVGEHDGRFALRSGIGGAAETAGLTPREAAVFARLDRPKPVADILGSRLEAAALDRLVARGLVLLSGVTPSDAAHVDGRLDAWDKAAAAKALTLFARRRIGSGERVADTAEALAAMIIAQVTAQSVAAILRAAFAEEPRFRGQAADALGAHALTAAGLDGHRGLIEVTLRLGLPIVGLGASAAAYYPAVAARLGTTALLPEHAGVANAIGAVVGHIRERAAATLTCPAEGRFTAHLPDGPVTLSSEAAALDLMRDRLGSQVRDAAEAAGAETPAVAVTVERAEAEIEGRRVLVEARVTAVATGRPRVARGAPAAAGVISA
jgi:N-methylhydantoinase A/oxoprolinase/acetone carboxylase beta subunit